MTAGAAPCRSVGTPTWSAPVRDRLLALVWLIRRWPLMSAVSQEDLEGRYEQRDALNIKLRLNAVRINR